MSNATLTKTGYTRASTQEESPTMNAWDERALEEVRIITQMMREHQKQISDLAKQRRSKVLRLRQHGITYREIAEVMETSEQTVYNIIRGDLK